MNIPFVNLKSQYSKIKVEIRDQIDQILESCKFIQGEYVESFETEFAQFHNSAYAVGCSNGTSAIALALEALGVGRDDEVITVANTFIATAEAICHVGAKPVFVDINPATYTIDASMIEGAITSKTKAIVPVHIYGNLCEMETIQKIAKQYSLYVVEDCAQAHLGRYKGAYAGTYGDMGTFSFYPGKNLGAYGDAGCIITNSKENMIKLKKLRDHGRLNKYEHDIIGHNCRLDSLQAGILLIKLKYLREWTQKRIENAQLYNKLLEKTNVTVMDSFPNSNPVYHLYVIQVDNRNELMSHLNKKGISTGIHYPIPLHQQPAFESLKDHYQGKLVHTENAAERIISLPMCPELQKDQIEYICREIEKKHKA